MKTGRQTRARGAGNRIEFSTVNISGHPMSAEGCRHLVDGHIRLSGVVLPVMRGTRGIKPFEPVSDARHTFFPGGRSEEHTSELQSLMRISYAVFCLKKKLYIKIQTD